MANGNVSLIPGGGGGARPLFGQGAATGGPSLGAALPGGQANLDPQSQNLMQYVQLLKAISDARKAQDASGGGGGGGLLSGMMGGKGGSPGGGTSAGGGMGGLEAP